MFLDVLLDFSKYNLKFGLNLFRKPSIVIARYFTFITYFTNTIYNHEPVILTRDLVGYLGRCFLIVKYF